MREWNRAAGVGGGLLRRLWTPVLILFRARSSLSPSKVLWSHPTRLMGEAGMGITKYLKDNLPRHGEGWGPGAVGNRSGSGWQEKGHPTAIRDKPQEQQVLTGWLSTVRRIECVFRKCQGSAPAGGPGAHPGWLLWPSRPFCQLREAPETGTGRPPAARPGPRW